MKSKPASFITGAHRLLRTLTLVLLPALPSENSPASVPANHRTSIPDHRNDPTERLHSQPYLAAIGPKALRFAELPQPVPMTAPPPPPPTGFSAPVAPDVAPVVHAAPVNEDPTPAKPAEEKPAEAAKPEDKPANRAPAPLLPDDARREVRPEDILPFFQFPGGPNGTTTIIRTPLMPSSPPPALPQSSATYIQK